MRRCKSVVEFRRIFQNCFSRTLLEVRKKLQKIFSAKLPICNLKIISTSPVRVKIVFTVKDKLLKILLSGLVYKCRCGACKATYYGKTKTHFKVRICGHLGISHVIGKKLTIDNIKLTAIQEHLLCCGYSSSFEDFSILNTLSYDVLSCHMMSTYPIVRIQMWFVQFSLLCCEFCILSKTGCMSI